MNPDQPSPGAAFKVVIAGGGVAGLEAMLALRSLAGDRVSVTLLSPEREFLYGPLAVAEPFGLGRRSHFKLADLVPAGGAHHHVDALAAVDGERRIALTRTGIACPYDALLIAVGTERREPLPGAITFPGPTGVTGMAHLLAELDRGEVSTVAFAQASRVGWPLPLYELALMTARHLKQRGIGADVELVLLTPEEDPLELFGNRGSAAVRSQLQEAGVRLRTGVQPVAYEGGELQLGDDTVAAERVVTLAVPDGRRIEGVPTDDDGYIEVDEHQRLLEIEGVYAAGDVTSFHVKQGGIAAQQGEVAAQAIAAAAGAPVTPEPFRPVLRGLLLTGGAPEYLRSPIAEGPGEAGDTATEPLWWPPAKIAAKHLGPLLALRAGERSVPAPPVETGISVAREFDPGSGDWKSLQAESRAAS